ncbi:MAG: hypothetical protein WCA46_19370 [Actinocatenispora sp.]
MGAELRAVRFSAADRYEAVFEADDGPLTVPCRLVGRGGGERVEPTGDWPEGTDAVQVERALLALAGTRSAAEDEADRGWFVEDPRHPARRAIQAAQRGDLDELRSLIDWPLSVLPSLAEGLDGLDDRSRAWAIGSALAEFEAARTDRAAAEAPVRSLAVRLAGALQVRSASVETRRGALRRLRIPDVPVTLPPDERHRLRELSSRATAVTAVVVALDARGEVPLAVAPDTGLLVVLV